MSKRFLIFCFLFVTISVLLVVFTTPPKKKLALVTVALAYSPPPCKPEFVPYFVGIQEKIFERRGIRVETKKFLADPLGRWTEDVVIGHADDFYRKDNNHDEFSYRPFLAHYSSQEFKNFAIFAPRNLPVSTLKKRLTLAYEDLGHGSGVIPLELINQLKLHWKSQGLDVETKKMRRDQILNRRDHFDAVLATEPFISILHEVNWVEIPEIPVQALLGHAWITGYTAISSKHLKLNPALSRQLIDAWWEAVDFLRAHPDSADKLTRACMEEEQGISRPLLPVGQWKPNEISPEALLEQMRIFQILPPLTLEHLMTKFLYNP